MGHDREDWRQMEAEALQLQSNVVPMQTEKRNRIDSRKVQVFGSSAALCFEETTSRRDGPTVSVDAAAKQGESVLWKEKIIFQFTVDELPVLAAVLLGVLPEFEFKFHGEKKAKSAGVYRRDNAVLFKVSDGSKSFTVPVPPGSLFHVSSLVMAQLAANAPGIDGVVMMAQIRSLSSMVKLPPPRPAAAPAGQQRPQSGPRDF